MTTSKIATITALLLATTVAASAQSMPGHNMATMGNAPAATTESILPEICKSGGEVGEMAPMGAMEMDEAHAALMAGMDQMNSDMMTSAMVEDIDVAFVCGMIPHHQGAIAMAKAELKYGDNEWAREMAQKVIDAQEQEIADLLAWLSEQAQ